MIKVPVFICLLLDKFKIYLVMFSLADVLQLAVVIRRVVFLLVLLFFN